MDMLAAILVVASCLPQESAPMPWAAALPDDLPGLQAGELLLGALNCIGCHAADRDTARQLCAPPAMLLDGIGARVTPRYLRAFLREPQRTKPGTTMPDVLHGDGDAIDALVHYLVSRGGPLPLDATPVRAASVAWGEQLFRHVGCVACHGSDGDPGLPIGALAAKTTLPALVRSLRDAHAPPLDLSELEAHALATYLLQDQLVRDASGGACTVRAPGLDYACYAGRYEALPDLTAIAPVAMGSVERFTLAVKPQDELFAIDFTGELTIAAAGDHEFFLESDDAARLDIDGRELIDNDGVHPLQERSASIALAAGTHSIRVAFSQVEGDLGLKVSLAGPGFTKREIEASELAHTSHLLRVPQAEPFALDAAKVAHGRELFMSRGCASCHGHDPARTIVLEQIAAVTRGCLAEQVRAPAADYHLSAPQRQALRQVLAQPERLRASRSASAMALRAMAALHCLACHERDGAGGPRPARATLFAARGNVDLGDEGRLPPSLTGVGRKLSAHGLESVLLEHLRVRPYLATRMPRYERAAVAPLLAWLEAADAAPADQPRAPAADAEIAAGRRLLGLRGLSCISCHGIQGHESRGIPAVDLAFVPERLRFAWFREYLLDPGRLRPGTRMPQFWVDGASPFADVLGGDPERQIAALWSYLSLGAAAPLPEGIDQGSGFELVVDNEPIVFRAFVNGVGPRAIAVRLARARRTRRSTRARRGWRASGTGRS
ncbi:MAG: PA14 domain-containing protein [Planctomycetota bacterium]